MKIESVWNKESGTLRAPKGEIMKKNENLFVQIKTEYWDIHNGVSRVFNILLSMQVLLTTIIVIWKIFMPDANWVDNVIIPLGISVLILALTWILAVTFGFAKVERPEE